MPETTIPEELSEDLVSTCRTTVGDELRSVTYFTRDGHRQVYLRSDLAADADLASFVANERLGFTSQHTYGRTELGAYRYTIRVFEHGYLTRVIVRDHGVFVTTDGMAPDRFDELAAAVKPVLERY